MPKETGRGRPEPGRAACSDKQLLRLSLPERASADTRVQKVWPNTDCTTKMLATHQLSNQRVLRKECGMCWTTWSYFHIQLLRCCLLG